MKNCIDFLDTHEYVDVIRLLLFHQFTLIFGTGQRKICMTGSDILHRSALIFWNSLKRSGYPFRLIYH